MRAIIKWIFMVLRRMIKREFKVLGLAAGFIGLCGVIEGVSNLIIKFQARKTEVCGYCGNSDNPEDICRICWDKMQTKEDEYNKYAVPCDIHGLSGSCVDHAAYVTEADPESLIRALRAQQHGGWDLDDHHYDCTDCGMNLCRVPGTLCMKCADEQPF